MSLVARLEERHRLAVEMAAHGAVSGTLREWPVLLEAFRLMGVMGNDGMGGAEMRAISQAIHGLIVKQRKLGVSNDGRI